MYEILGLRHVFSTFQETVWSHLKLFCNFGLLSLLFCKRNIKLLIMFIYCDINALGMLLDLRKAKKDSLSGSSVFVTALSSLATSRVFISQYINMENHFIFLKYKKHFIFLKRDLRKE